MPLSNLVCDRELAEKLKSLGYPQKDSIFVYLKTKHAKGIYYVTDAIRALLNDPTVEWCAAPTAGELGEELPEWLDIPKFKYHGTLQIQPIKNYWQIGYFSEPNVIDYRCCEKTLANAMAKMLVFLREQGLIQF